MKKFLFLLCLFLLTPILTVQAAILKADTDFYISSDEVVNENIYTAGTNIIIDGLVTEDVYAAGSNISINNNVEKDVNIAGSNITLNGHMGDDVRAAGGNITISSEIQGELMAASGTLSISPDSIIHGKTYIGGGRIILNGQFDSDVVVGGEDVFIKGIINGNVIIKNVTKLTVDESAQINGNLKYSASKEAIIPVGTVKGVIDYTVKDMQKKPKKEAFNFYALFGAFFIYKLVACLLFSLLIFGIFKKGVNISAEYSQKNFGKEIIRGFLVLVAVPIAIIIIIFTVVGVPIAIIFSLIYFAFIMLARVMARILFGAWIVKLLSKKSKKWEVTWQSVLIGVVLLSLIELIPVFGWFITLIFFLVALGTLTNYTYQWMEKIRNSK